MRISDWSSDVCSSDLPIEDQRLAGGLAWSYGEAPTLLMLLYVMHRWSRDDTAQATAADRRADAHGDRELDAYNDYLTRLHQNDRYPMRTPLPTPAPRQEERRVGKEGVRTWRTSGSP